jgi:hypothetical protein
MVLNLLNNLNLLWLLILFIGGCNETPGLNITETENNRAGRVEYLSGSLLILKQNGTIPVKTGDEVRLGNHFQAKEKNAAKILTEGNWWIALEGEGEYIFQDAKTNKLKSKHSATWEVRFGNLRAKPKDFDPTEHYLKIKTPRAMISLKNGELGVSVNRDGTGQAWLYRGDATITWENGDTKSLQNQQMSHL